MVATARLEHINLTVSDAKATAARLAEIFGWKIRWSGRSIHDGHSVHVGNHDTYLALYTPKSLSRNMRNNYAEINGLNHVGIVVEDLEKAEQKVIAAGYTPNSHQEYEPGRRFYFDDEDGIEFEVISYAPKTGDFWREFKIMLGSICKNAAILR